MSYAGSSVASRRWNKARRFGALVAAAAVAAGGIVIAQQVQSAPPAEAAQANGIDPNGQYAKTAPAPLTANIPRGNLTAAVTVDDQTLYYGLNSTYDRMGRFSTDANGRVVSNAMTELAETKGDVISAGALTTLAVDAGAYTGKPALYTWYWDSGNSFDPSEGSPGSDYIPVARYAAGPAGSGSGVAASASPSNIYWLPRPATAEGGRLSYNYWSGGEIIQKTGQIFFSGGECSGLNGDFRMMVFDPKTNKYMTSGQILPAAASDNIFGSGNTCGGHGYVSSDMALDGYGNAYILVKGEAPSSSIWAPIGSNGRPVNNVRRVYLVRVVPGADQSGWKYNIVTMLTYGGDGSTDAQGYFGRYPYSDVGGGDYVYGMAFLNGLLYIGRTDLYAINPMSGTATHVPYGYNTSLDRTVDDLASGQTAYVVAGRVVNDRAGTGAVDIDTGVGVAGVDIALYSVGADGAWKLEGTRQTDGSGNYSFIVGGSGTYQVRLSQPQVDFSSDASNPQYVNALQTYASAGAGPSSARGANTVVAHCFNYSTNNIDAVNSSGPCVGALPAPYVDQPLGEVGSTIAASAAVAVPSYSTVTLSSPDDIPPVDFAITAAGSFGDAAAGPSSMSAGAPVHVAGSLSPSQVWLGDSLGKYDGPATDNAAHNATDDGVWIDTYLGRTPIDGQVFVVGGSYAAKAQVNGSLATSSQTTLRGWTTSTATGTGSGAWAAAPTWTPAIGADGLASAAWSPSTTTTGITTAQNANFRVSVQAGSTAPVKADNSAGEYQGSSASRTQSWTTLGEIEDYRYQVAGSVYRVAAKTTGATGTFTIDGVALTASGSAPAIGLGKAATVGSKSVTATVPSNDWKVASVVIRNTFTGAEVSRPAVTVSGLNSSFSFNAAASADVIVEVTFAKAPDATKSQLTLTPTDGTVSVGSVVALTATVRDSDGSAVSDSQIRFTSSNSAVAIQDGNGAAVNVCTTNANGVCELYARSTQADTYTDAITAEVQLPSTAWAAIKDSPATVTFKASDADPGNSSLTVTPGAALNANGALLVGAAAENTYTATATVKDALDNLIDDATVFFDLEGDEGAGGPSLSEASCQTVAGVCSVTVVSSAPGTFELEATLPDPVSFEPKQLNGSPKDLKYDRAGISAANSSLVVSPKDLLIGEQATVTVTVKDALANPATGLAESAFALNSGCATASAFNEAGDGVYTWSITSAQPCDTVIKATPEGVQLEDTADFRAIVPSEIYSSLTLDKTSAPVGTSVLATVAVKDAHDRPIPGLAAADFETQADPANIVIDWSSFAETAPGSGVYTYTLTAEIADDYTVQATVAGTVFTGANVKQIVFVPGDPSAANSSFSIDPGQLAVGGTAVATLTVKDAYDNPVSGLADNLALDPGALTAGGVGTGAAGTYTWSLTTSTAGSYEVGVTVPTAAGSFALNGQVVFEPGSVASASLALDKDTAPVSVAADAQVKATVTALDASDNPVLNLAAEDIVWSFAKAGAASSDVIIQLDSFHNNGDGTYEVLLFSTTAGTYDVEAAVSGQTTNSVQVTFTAGPPSADTTTFEVAPADVVIPGSATATLTVQDAFGNAVTGLTGADIAVNGDPAGLTVGTLSETADGVYTASLTSAAARSYVVEAVFAGLSKTAPVGFTFAGAGQVTLAITQDAAPVSAAADAAVDALVTVADAAGIAITDLTEEDIALASTPSGVQVKPGSFRNNGDGSYSYSLYATKAALYEVTATVDSQSGQDNILFTPLKPLAGKVDFSVDPALVTIPGNTTATLTVFDIFDNAVDLDPAADVTLNLPNGVSQVGDPVKQVDQFGNATGSYKFTLTSATPGAYVIEAVVVDSLGANVAKQASATWSFAAVGQVGLAVSPASHVVSDAAGAEVVATVTVTASNGAPVTNLTADDIALSSSPVGVQIKSGSFINNGDGTYRYTIYAVKAGSYTLTAANGGQSDTAAVVFTAGSPVDSAVTWTITPAKVQIPGSATAELTVRDAFDNPVTTLEAKDIAIAQTPAGLTIEGPVQGSGSDGLTGVYVYTLTSADPSQNTVTATLKDGAGQNIVRSAAVEFAFGAISSVDLTLSAASHQVSNEAGASVTATVKVVDASDVGISNLTAADFNLSSTPAGVNVKTGSFLNLGAGSYSFTVYSQTADDYDLTAQVSGLNDTEAISFTAGPPNSAQTTWTINPSVVAVPGQATGALTVKDQYGNPIKGLTANEITLSSVPLDPPLTVTGPTESTAGVYTYLLSSEDAEAFTVTATVGAIQKTAAVRFSAGQVDPSKSHLEASPEEQMAGQKIAAKVTVRDAYDNPIEGLVAADFTIAGTPTSANPSLPSVVGDNFVESPGGVYTFVVISTAAGDFTLSARVSGTDLDDQPVVTFTAAGVCVVNCETTDPDKQTRAVMVDNDQPDDGVSKDTARVWAFDTYGNLVKNAVVVAVREGTTLQPETQTVLTGSDGAAMLEWTSLSIGTFTATVAVDDKTGFNGSVLNQIRFVTTGISAGNSSLTVTAPDGYASPIPVRQSYTAQVTVRDAQNQLLANVPVSFEISSSAASLSADFCNTDSNGSCSVKVTSRVAGAYDLSATVSESGVKTDVKGSPVEVEFKAGPLCVGDSCTPLDPTHRTRVEVTKNGQPADGTSADEATLYAYDADGNPVVAFWTTTPADDSLVAALTSGFTNDEGKAIIAYTSAISGSHKADVAAGGSVVSGSPIALSFTAGAASKVALSVSPATSLTVGQSFTATATATDLGGALVEGVPVSFTAEDGASFVGLSTCVTGPQGSCQVKVTSKLAGTYEIDGSFSGTALTDAPKKVVFTAGPVCVEKCTPVNSANVTRVEIIQNGANFDGQARDIAKVWAYDEFGNPVAGQTTASTTVDPALAIQSPITPTGADGTTTIWYTSTAAGAHLADVTVDGKTPAGSPLTLAFGAGLGDPKQSSYVIVPKLSGMAVPLVAGADDENTYVVTATVKDYLGALAPGDTVSFSIVPSDPTWAGGQSSCQTDATGQCSVEVYSTKAGAFGLAATLAKGPIGSAKQIAWAADEVCGVECTPQPGVTNITHVEVESDNQTADNASPDVVRVFAYDEWGNPVPNALVTSAAETGSEALRIEQGIAPTNSTTGQTTVSYYSAEAGQFAASILVGGKTPAGSPVTLNFHAGEICLAPACTPDSSVPNDKRTRLEVMVDYQPADGVTPDVVRVFAFDRLGNPVANAPVSAPLPPASRLQLQAPIPSTNEEGWSDLDFVSTLAGAHETEVYVYLEVGGQPTEVKFTPQPGTTPPAAMQSSPVTLHFVAGLLDPDKSSLTVTPESLPVTQTATAVFVARDASDNPVSLTEADLDLRPGGLTVLTGPTETAPGEYAWTLTTVAAKDYTVEVAAGGAVLSDSVVFVPGAVDPSKSSLTVDPASQKAGSPVKATVTAKDASDNLVTGLSAAVFAVTGTATAANPSLPAVAGTDFIEASSGVYTFNLTSRLAGEFEVAATVAGTLLDDKPLVTFTAGGICVSNCDPVDKANVTRAEMVSNDASNDGVQEDTAKVWAFDYNGNPIPGAEVVATRQDAQLEPETQTVQTGADGTALIAWTSRSIGAFTAQVTVDGVGGFDGSVLNDIRFSTTGINAEKSQLVVTAPSGQTAPITVGQPYTAQVTVRDAQEQPLSGVVVSFTAAPKPGAPAGAAAQLSAATCQTAADGVCSITVTAKIAADYEVRATVPVNGTATEVSGSPADIAFKAGAVCVGASCDPVDKTHLTRVQVTKNGQKADGQALDEATVYAYDYDGNPVPGALWTTTTTDPNLVVVAASGSTGADGTAVMQYASAYSGAHQASAEVGGKTPSGSPFTLSFAAGDAAQVVLTSSPASPRVVGLAYTLTATATDVAGAAVGGVVVDFTAPAAVSFDAGRATCTTSEAAGTCSVQVVATEAGVYEVAATVDSVPLTDSPATLEWTAGAVCVEKCNPSDPSHVTRVEVIKNGANFDGQDRDVAKVYAYDEFGNPVPGQPVTSTARDGALAVQPDITATGADGTTTIWYTSTVAGAHQADVKVADRDPKNSPVNLGFGAGLGDPSKSSFTITPKLANLTAPLIAGDADANTYVVTATVRDFLDQLVDGDTVSFGIEPQGPVWADGAFACQTVNGVCSVEISSTLAGTFSLTGSLAKGAIGSAQGVMWLVDEVCGVGCDPKPGVDDQHKTRVEVTSDGNAADDQAADIATVYAFDQWGNPVKNQLVVSAASDSTLRVQTGIAPTDADGVSTVRYYSAVAGAYTASVTVGGKTPAGSPVTVNFVAGEVCVAPLCTPDPSVPNDRRTRVEVTLDNQTADETAEDIATVYAFDKLGNPTPNIKVDAVPLDADLTVKLPIAATDQNGESAFGLTSAVAGAHQARVYVTVAGVLTEIQFTPQVQVLADGPSANTGSSPITVTFEAGAPCVAPACTPDPDVPNDKRSRVEVNPDYQAADGASQDVANVYIFDAQGNPVPGAKVTSTTAAAALTVQPAASVALTSAAGATSVWYSASTDGAFAARVFVEVAGAPAEVVFTPQPVPPASGPAPVGMVSSPITLNFVDVTAPSAPTISSPANGADLNDATPVIVGSGEPGASVEVRDGTTVICQTTVADDGSWSCTPTADLAEGQHVITAVQTDADDNQSGPSAPITVTIDTIAPDSPTVTRPTAGQAVADATPEVAGQAEPGSVVTVADADGSVLCTARADAVTGAWSCVSTGLGEGPQTISVTATDAAGNTSQPTEVTFTVDTVQPFAGSLVIVSPAEGSLVNTAAPVIEGVAEAGSTVTVREGSDLLCQAVADATGAWSCQPSADLAEGQHVIAAVSTDAAGNASDPVTRTFGVDLTAPDAPVITEPTGAAPINDSTPVIAGQDGEPGAVVTVTDENGLVLCVSTVAADGSWSCSSAVDLADGDHVVNATQTDPAGNVSDETSVAITVDTVAPDAPVVTRPADGEAVGTATPTVEGTAEPGSTVTVDAGDGNVCTVVAAADGSFSCTLPDALPEGPAVISVTATDPAGNESPAVEVPITVDVTAPAAPVITRPADGEAVDTATPTVEGTAEPGSTVTVDAGDGKVCTATAGADGSFSCTLPDALPEGPAVISVTATDPAGNESPAAEVTVTVDTTAPEAPTVTAPIDGQPINTATPTVEGTAEPGSTVTVDAGDGNVCTATAGADGAYSCTLPEPLPEGPAVIEVTAVDEAGNESPATEVTVTVDLTAPEAPVVTAPQPGETVGTGTPTVEGTAEPGSTVTVDAGDGNTCTVIAAADGSFSCSLPATLPDGPVTISVTATDPAGNESPATEVPITVDVIGPAAPVITEPSDGEAVGTDTPTVSGVAEPGSTVTVDAGDGNTCTVTADADGSFSCTLPDALPEGPAVISVTATDEAGNESPAAEVAITVDTVAPDAPVVTRPADGESVDTSTPTVEGTAEPGSTVTVDAGDGNTCTVTAAADGSFSCTLPAPLPDGPAVIEVTATDPAGNESPT
ncbi:MAG: Ig-like domain-containing protein, partial [Propionibacteriaceae bacterium]|nr:Ig-like domain-containing protein [Propionibacteriaceae bacterium]